MQLKLTWKEFVHSALRNLDDQFNNVMQIPDKIRLVKKNAYQGEIEIAEIPDFVYVDLLESMAIDESE